MGVRRVVTGHTPAGTAVVSSDELVELMPLGDRGSATGALWFRGEVPQFPDDGREHRITSPFPPPGGCVVAMMEIAPDGDEFHEFVREGLAQWADPNEPGMHRTPTIDFEVVLEGSVGLELDNGTEVILGPGDVVVQNGTRHRWHNRGTTVARYFAVSVGANNEIEGGGPV
jgi:mannose-6-phosphate isomerase-like protein (cupin superfamily)